MAALFVPCAYRSQSKFIELKEAAERGPKLILKPIYLVDVGNRFVPSDFGGKGAR